ncbi:hypothetical protein OHJ16_15035 [Actinomyces israelii]|uniref:Uncharacterized protein n=1 Tax=Actinomyces israelii TaxID=1659 RepID=A0ABT4ICS4_9ACTO|nr:hypothetical protein [Actinomyces israelii]MCZ0859351.1 hypothetical protein [Actinomyces israelii]
MMTIIMFDIDAMREVPPQHRLMGATGYKEKLSDTGERVIIAADGCLDEEFFDALKASGLTAASRRTKGAQHMVTYPRDAWLQSFRGVLNATSVDNQGHLGMLSKLLLDYVGRVQRATGYRIEIPSLTGVIIDKTNRRADVVPMTMKARPRGDVNHSDQAARPASIIVKNAFEGERRLITAATSYGQKLDALVMGLR